MEPIDLERALAIGGLTASFLLLAAIALGIK